MQKRDQKRLSASVLASAILALGSVAFTSVSVAATPEHSSARQLLASAVTVDADQQTSRKGADRRAGHKRGHHHKRFRSGHAAMLIPGYGPIPKDVVESLSLNADQVALLDDAKSFMKELRQEKREQFHKAKENRASGSERAALDPHAALQRQQERHEAMLQTRTKGTEKWLELWDALDDGQQQTLSEYVADRAEKRAQRRAKYEEKRTERKKTTS